MRSLILGPVSLTGGALWGLRAIARFLWLLSGLAAKNRDSRGVFQPDSCPKAEDSVAACKLPFTLVSPSAISAPEVSQLTVAIKDKEMNKNWIIGLVLLAVAAGGYYFYSSKQAVMEEAAKLEQAAKAEAEAAEKAIEDAAAKVAEEAEAAEEAVKAEAEAAVKAAEDAAKAAEDAAAKAAEEAAAAVEGAADAAEDAVEGAVDAAEGAVEGAADAAEEAVEGAADVAESAAEGAVDAAEAEMDTLSAEELLKPENFNLEKVSALIDGTDLSDQEKTTIKTALDQAKNSPELLSAVLDRVKAVLGL